MAELFQKWQPAILIVGMVVLTIILASMVAGIGRPSGVFQAEVHAHRLVVEDLGRPADPEERAAAVRLRADFPLALPRRPVQLRAQLFVDVAGWIGAEVLAVEIVREDQRGALG